VAREKNGGLLNNFRTLLGLEDDNDDIWEEYEPNSGRYDNYEKPESRNKVSASRPERKTRKIEVPILDDDIPDMPKKDEEELTTNSVKLKKPEDRIRVPEKREPIREKKKEVRRIIPEEKLEVKKIEPVKTIEKKIVKETPVIKPVTPNLGKVTPNIFGNGAYDTIFIKPTQFSDCKKIANYIRENKIVTVNLEGVNNETAQRLIDFLSGAMSVTEAQFITVSSKVYTSVPKKVPVYVDGEKVNQGEKFA